MIEDKIFDKVDYVLDEGTVALADIAADIIGAMLVVIYVVLMLITGVVCVVSRTIRLAFIKAYGFGREWIKCNDWLARDR